MYSFLALYMQWSPEEQQVEDDTTYVDVLLNIRHKECVWDMIHMASVSLLIWYCYNKPVLSNIVPRAVLGIFFLE